MELRVKIRSDIAYWGGSREVKVWCGNERRWERRKLSRKRER